MKHLKDKLRFIEHLATYQVKFAALFMNYLIFIRLPQEVGSVIPAFNKEAK